MNKPIIEFCGLSQNNIYEIITLIAGEIPAKAKDLIQFEIVHIPKGVLTYYNPAMKKLQIDLPMEYKDGEYDITFGYTINIYENGFVSYCNWSGVKFMYNNSLKIYKILLNNLNHKN